MHVAQVSATASHVMSWTVGYIFYECVCVHAVVCFIVSMNSTCVCIRCVVMSLWLDKVYGGDFCVCLCGGALFYVAIHLGS